MNLVKTNQIQKNKINHMEQLVQRKSDAHSHLLLAWRYYLASQITGDSDFFAFAVKQTNLALKHYRASLPLYFFRIFLALTEHDIPTAEAGLEKLKPYRNFFKLDAPQEYGTYLYLSAWLDWERGKKRAFQKNVDALIILEPTNLPNVSVYMARLYSLQGENESAAQSLIKAYKMGERSTLLFLSIRDLLEENDNGLPSNLPLVLVPFLRWAMVQGMDLEDIINRHSESFIQVFHLAPSLFHPIYKAYKPIWLLEQICIGLIKDIDLSLDAYYFYREAVGRQLEIPQLNEYLVRSAYKNKLEDLSRYSLSKYLLEYGVDVDFELKPYIYHLVLTNRKMQDFIPGLELQIKQFALYCMENRFQGRYYYTLYLYMVEKCSDDQSMAAYVKIAQGIVSRALFRYRITVEHPAVHWLWVLEKEKKDMVVYPVRDGEVNISALDNQFAYYCLSKDQTEFIDATIQWEKQVESVDLPLYQLFYTMGHPSTELLIHLSRYYMSLEHCPPEAMRVFEQMGDDPSLSRWFRMQILAALGHLYASRSMDDRAVACYRKVDENCIDDKYLDQMLLTYISTGDYDHAVHLIVKKSECLTDRSLFYALKQIAPKKTFDREIANTAYELILKCRYDKDLLRIVLHHYNGSQQEWQALSHALLSMSIQERQLDEIILKNAIFMHMPDKGVQRVFMRMAELDESNPLCSDFASYLSYEMILNDLKPEYEGLDTMEKLYFHIAGKKQRLLWGIGLTHCYIRHEITTLHSNDILIEVLTLSEEKGILFPIFKQIKDKNKITPYIEKNQPFLYRCHPGKTVNLYYRAENETKYRKKAMGYFRFGLYLAHIPHFYGEKLYYYFSEEMPSGSIVTKEAMIENSKMNLSDLPDSYFVINNALIYEQMFKYEQVEQIITKHLQEKPRTKGWLL